MITSPQNEKLKLVRKLIANRRDREQEGLFVAEGEDLVAAGLQSEKKPLFLLRQAGEDRDLPGTEEAIEVERRVLAATSSLGSGCRILGVWPTTWRKSGESDLYIYLDAVSDPGNIGAIIRTAHALVAGTVVPGPGCADPFSPKAVRASMGSVFSCPPERAGLEDLPGPRLGLVAHGGSWPLDTALRGAGTPRTICLGSEREGLSPAVIEACDRLVTIPLPGGAESLNVAAAAAICLERVSSLAVLATGSELNPPNEGTDA